ncbi:MAG: transporter substrate-binding protein [Minwuiales bacterium]|nr:transporter substrate-binding protein [Minwuiales bacterium]
MTFNRRKFLQTSAAAAAAGTVLPRVAQAADEIVVSQIHDQSGIFDIYGNPMVETFNLAVDEINASGGLLGKQVRSINYDPQSKMELYGQYAQQSALKDRVSVVHGGITSASREVIRPVLRRYNTLYFYNTLYEGGVCDRNTFCTGTTPAQTVEKLVPYVTKNFGKKVYILAADYNYGQITAKWVTKFVRDNGGEVVETEFFPLDVTNFGPTIQKIQAAKPDSVMSALVGGAHLSFYRQWHASGMKNEIPIASTTFGAGNEHIVLTEEEGNGIVYACGYFMELDTPDSKAYVARFAKKYGENHSYLTELPTATYEGVMLWAEAVKKAGTTDRMKVIEALEDNLSIDGPTGKVTVDPKTHHVIRSALIAECHNKGFRLLESHENQFPSDTAAFCDLEENPNDNTHYEIKI